MLMEEPLVSVIVPVYNADKYIKNCIESILSQCYHNFELILVNDGSTDGSEEQCMAYTSRTNVQYYSQPNGGVTSARKKGFELSKGEWIVFVDADDSLETDALKVLVESGIHSDIVIGSTQRGNAVVCPKEMSRDLYLEKMYARMIPCSLHSKMFRKSLFVETYFDLPRDLVFGEDYIMNLFLAIANKKTVSVCKKVVYNYHIE